VGTNYAAPEDVASIKQNAPGNFKSQYSLKTPDNYEQFVRTNFSNFVSDVACMNNKTYLNSYLEYFYDLGLTQPQLESRALFSQVNFADSCNFNNVYIFLVPKSISGSLSYVNPAQKSLIIETIQDSGIMNGETVVMDPVYMAVDIALGDSNEVLISDSGSTKLLILKDPVSQRNPMSIQTDVANVFNDYFDRSNTSLGQTVDVQTLTNSILGVNGVKEIFTYRPDLNLMVPGLRMIIFNPIYGDVGSTVIAGNYPLQAFQFPYLFTTNFLNKIIVQ
jgi:hypothetical protein